MKRSKQPKHTIEDLIELTRGLFIFDVRGRIFFNGEHVGWIRKDAGFYPIKEMARVLGAEMPLLFEEVITYRENDNHLEEDSHEAAA